MDSSKFHHIATTIFSPSRWDLYAFTVLCEVLCSTDIEMASAFEMRV